LIQFFHVGKRYPGGQSALHDVTFEIPRGQFVFLTGSSGAGKTTLLRLIFREEVPTEGQILVNGRNVSSIPQSKIPYLRRTIGVVFQDFRLIARKTVFENVTYLPRILGVDLNSQKRMAYHSLRRVGLAHRLNSFPPELSGGEQQRVAIARALINEPEILIADEPTGNLDPELSREILKLLLEVNLKGTTVILATHDRETIQRVGKRVITLDRGGVGNDVILPGTDPPALRIPGERTNLSDPADRPDEMGESEVAGFCSAAKRDAEEELGESAPAGVIESEATSESKPGAGTEVENP
jgi:cell division transport system ATP-binding protein